MLRRVCSYTSFGLYRSFAAGSRFQNIQRYYCEPKEVSERATKMFESILASTPSNPDSALLKQNSYNMQLDVYVNKMDRDNSLAQWKKIIAEDVLPDLDIGIRMVAAFGYDDEIRETVLTDILRLKVGKDFSLDYMKTILNLASLDVDIPEPEER